jgi:hypothetical protein
MSMPMSFRGACFIAAIPLALVACSDALSPKPAIDVALRISDQQGPFAVQYQSGPEGMLCDVTFEASALGQRAHAVWQEASVLFYTSPNNGKPYDSVLVSANDVRTTFSADTIAPGQVEHTRWLFATTTVIGIGVNFRYQVDPGGEVKAATSYFTCGGGTGPLAISAARNGMTPSIGSPSRIRIDAATRLITRERR